MNVRSRSGYGARGRRLGGALAGALFALPGCYKYVPTTIDVTPVDENVRLVVTQAGLDELAAFNGADGDGPVSSVDGRFAGLEEGALLMRVPMSSSLTTPGAARFDQLIRVPSGEIVSMERREVDRAKTALLLAGAVGGATMVVLRIMNAGGESTDPPVDPVLYLFSIPIG